MKITAIIPAYNEENTICDVIEAVQKCGSVNDIIVVSDGSTDRTAEAASSMGVRVIDLKVNVGKGGAMKAGLDSCDSEIILFLDADLIGLKKEHIESLLIPVTNDEADMTVGVFRKGRLSTDFAQFVSPYLSGQRVVKRCFLSNLNNLDITKYGAEIALTKYARRESMRVLPVDIYDATHVMKEEKLGFFKGFKARMKMYRDIVKCLMD